MILDYLEGKKIKLTFEKSIYDILQYDLFTFNVKSMSNLIECVVLAYCRDSRELAKIEQKNDTSFAVRALLSDKSILFKKALVNLSMAEGKKPRHFSGEEHKSYGWTITVKAYEELKADGRTDNEPYSFIGKLMEEFAFFTVAEKERIIMHDAIDEINNALKKKLPFEYTSKAGNLCVMHPDRIAVDPQLQYTYIIGHSVAIEDYDAESFVPNQDNIKNIRFINLRYNEKNRRWINLRYGEKIKTNAEIIDKRLKSVTPAFVGEPVFDVKVQLTEWGERTYKSIIQNRPRYIFKADEYIDGFKEYTFRCTLFQAAIYFSNFEDSARIISPPEAVERIKSRIDALNRIYN